MKLFKKKYYDKVFEKEKSLIEILNELTIYCKSATGKDEDISLVLPKAVLDHSFRQALPKERIILYRDEDEVISRTISKIHGNGGTVTLFNADLNEVKLKESL